MLKLGKFGIAVALALLVALLMTTGTFAQSVKANPDHSQSVKATTMMVTPQVAQQPLQATRTRQATQKLAWGPGWGRGGFHNRFFGHRHFFFHRHRFFRHRFFDGGCPDCDCDGW